MSPLIAIRDAVDDGEPNPEGQTLTIVSTVFGALSIAFVISRWIIRIRIHKLIGADDWVILAALVSLTPLDTEYTEVPLLTVSASSPV